MTKVRGFEHGVWFCGKPWYIPCVWTWINPTSANFAEILLFQWIPRWQPSEEHTADQRTGSGQVEMLGDVDVLVKKLWSVFLGKAHGGNDGENECFQKCFLGWAVFTLFCAFVFELGGHDDTCGLCRQSFQGWPPKFWGFYEATLLRIHIHIHIHIHMYIHIHIHIHIHFHIHIHIHIHYYIVIFIYTIYIHYIHTIYIYIHYIHTIYIQSVYIYIL